MFNVHNQCLQAFKMVFQTGSSSYGDEGHHLLCRGYYDAVKCSERRAHLLICPCYPKLFSQAPYWVPKVLHSGGSFHCPQVHWCNTSHLHWAWSAGFKLRYHEQGVIYAQRNNSERSHF